MRSARQLMKRWMGGWAIGLLLGASVSAQTFDRWTGGAAAQTGQSTEAVSEFSRSSLLVHAPDGVVPGAQVWAGLRIEHAPEWHSYWKNPGDSGLPTELEWTLPDGVTAGDIVWPAPQKFPLGDLANYGYEGLLLLPVPLTLGPTWVESPLRLEVLATWLICRKECVPEEAVFTVDLPLATPLTRHQALFEAAWAAEPRAIAANSSSALVGPDGLALQVDGLPMAWRQQSLELFVGLTGIIEPGAPWRQTWLGDTWQAQVPLSSFRMDSPETLSVVLTWPEDDRPAPLAAVSVVLPVSGPWPAPQATRSTASDALTQALADNAARVAAQQSGPLRIGLWAALLGALVGGLILNLMPCVFPVLAIKVLAFSSQGPHVWAHRANGLAYTAGVVLSFVALGALLLGLRATGEQLGWGFQLQNPWVVASLATLFTLIGLNLAGLFEVGHILPSRVATLQAKHPTGDAFLTGVLATAIASPCTAPFMGASLGLAIALPTTQALLVFAMLGVGMALPYLAASWWPALARALPKPGAWMNTFKQAMAFPMLATVVWLLWVLGQQSGIDGVAALMMWLVVLSLALWTLGQSTGVRRVLGTVALLSLMGLTWVLSPYVAKPVAHPGSVVQTAVQGVQWEPWSPGREAALRDAGQPVFVDFTAAWCVTCQLNKNNVLSDRAFLHRVQAAGVHLLRADWTRRDPAVTQALAALGRNGVPVYVVHRPERAPVVLSELLTVRELLEALQDL